MPLLLFQGKKFPNLKMYQWGIWEEETGNWSLDQRGKEMSSHWR